MTQIIPTAEPFLFLGESSKPACLLIHGFTGTPKEMRWMGEFLNRPGYTCLGIRLADHATDPEDMIHSKDERYVLPDNMELIYADLINTSDKTKFYITESGHVVPRDAARQQAFQYALEFIQRIESPRESN